MGKALITIFTPTYNRKALLARVYESLKSQTNKEFIWMVIDDGSTDDTEKYIQGLIDKEKEFEIQYYYKENGGLFTGYNEAIKHFQTELCMCCDSDDWLTNDCVEVIKETWEHRKHKNIAGIIGLDCTPNGDVIGKILPTRELINYNELFINGELIGDKKIVVRSELYKEQKPMKAINKEKNFNPNYYNIVVSEKYEWIGINRPLCIVEYQQDGMTNSIFKQYMNSPNSFIELRKLYCSLRNATFVFKCKHLIHYDAECILAGRIKDIFSNKSPDRTKTTYLFPAGVILYLYILFKSSK